MFQDPLSTVVGIVMMVGIAFCVILIPIVNNAINELKSSPESEP